MHFEITNSNIRVLGSQHVLPADAPAVPSWIQQAYDWADSLVMEHDVSQAVEVLRAHGRTSRRTSLSARQIDVLSRFWDARIGELTEFKPWAVFFLATNFFLQPVHGVEEWVKQRAAMDGKRISYLEEASDFAKPLDQVPEQVFLSEIDVLVEQPDLVRTRFLAIHGAWMSRSVERMLSVVSDLAPFRVPELHQAALAGRNRRWVPRILGHVTSGRKTLVLVGALHLCGKGNVTELIEQEGHKVVWL